MSKRDEGKKRNMHILCIIVLILGVSSGAATIHYISPETRDLLIQNFNVVGAADGTSCTVWDIGIDFARNAAFIIFIALFGLTPFGKAPILLGVGIRAYICGFAISFVSYNMGWNGVTYSTLAILPSSLLFLLTLTMFGVYAYMFLHEERPNLTRYLGVTTVALTVVASATLVKNYVSPWLLTLI